MKKIFLTTLLVISLVSFSNAQDYTIAAGVRAGASAGSKTDMTPGLTAKYFISDNTAIEGILTARWGWGGFNITGLYEIHNELPELDGLNWYYGFGGHLGVWNGNAVLLTNIEKDKSYTILGVDGVLGLEYNFSDLPLNVSVDIIPSFNIGGYTGFWLDGGVSARYVFY